MQKLRLGRSDVEVSALCFGTDLIGSKVDRRTSFELLDLFHEQGGAFIDTGNFYAAWLPGCKGGESETTIGWTGYSAVEQRHTYLRPRHGADFGPQIPINEDMKGYCRSHGITLIAYSALLQGAYTREERPVPMQYAGVDSDARLAALKEV